MIKLRRKGRYKLIETKMDNKILYLDHDTYAWVEPADIGEMLVASRRSHKTDYILSAGSYRIYDVADEPHLTDQEHLELEAGPRIWQGYLLLSGLPDRHKYRARMVPTTEIITGNPKYDKRLGPKATLATSNTWRHI